MKASEKRWETARCSLPGPVCRGEHPTSLSQGCALPPAPKLDKLRPQTPGTEGKKNFFLLRMGPEDPTARCTHGSAPEEKGVTTGKEHHTDC